MKKVLAILAINPDYIQFAIPELKSILSPLKIPFTTLFSESGALPQQGYKITHKNLHNFPYITLTVPEFQKHREYFEIASKKAVMISKFILLISSGKNYQQLLDHQDQDILDSQCRDWNQRVACDFVTRNRVITREQQNKKIHQIFQKMNVQGKIDIKNAKKRLQLVEQHQWYQNHHQQSGQKTLQRVYFGIQLSNFKIAKAKFNINYQLNKRIYLGPTSTDNGLAFLMCNQAKINEYSSVFDPFVGTGGLIIPPASHGASVFGCDLDMRVINGYAVGRINKKSPYYAPQKQLEAYMPKINLNFDQYELPHPNILRMDATKCRFAPHTQFDAIITDPPYGIRAMSRSLKKKEKVLEVDIEQQTTEEKNIEKMQERVQQSVIKQQVVIKQGVLKQQEVGNQAQQQQIDAEDVSWQKQECLAKTQQQLEALKKKKMKKQKKKQSKQKRRLLITEEQHKQIGQIREKMNRDRIDNWDKFDKAKIDTTQREVIFQGLLNIGRHHLKIGGRLVFLYPVYEEETFQGIKNMPPHHGYDVIDMSQNILSLKNSRILVTMERIQ